MKLADGETLIHKTYARVKALGADVLTVTNVDYYFMSLDEQEGAGVFGSFLLEPFGRNTAPAVALAAKWVVETKGSDALMLVLAADHLVADQTGFATAVFEAAKLAGQGYLVTFGIEPRAPETGFGYIELGDSLGVGNKVVRFVEKPDLETAEGYVSSRNFLWNSGMFCFKAGVLLEELAKAADDVAKMVDVCWQGLQPLKNLQITEIPAELFKKIPDISIDHAVMERSDKVAVVQANFGWNDIGSWNAIRDLVQPDAAQNRALGEVIFVDTKNTFVQSEDRLVATVGVSDLMIVDTPDALLVAHPDKAQDVKKAVARLKQGAHDVFK